MQLLSPHITRPFRPPAVTVIVHQGYSHDDSLALVRRHMLGHGAARLAHWNPGDDPYQPSSVPGCLRGYGFGTGCSRGGNIGLTAPVQGSLFDLIVRLQSQWGAATHGLLLRLLPSR